MKTTAIAAAAVLAVAGSAQAGLGDFMEMQTIPFGGELSPFGPELLSFNQFQEGPNKILKAIQIEFTATISAMVTAENENPQPAPEFGMQLTGFVTVDVPAPAPGQSSISANLSDSEQSGGVGPSDGVPGSGPDFFDFGLLTDTGGGDDVLFVGVDDVSAFVGNGTVDAEVAGQGGFTVTGASNAVINITDFMVSGEVKITYFYNIPSPGAAALMGLAGFAGIRRRRA